jgi:SRSO17 transposase
MGIFNTDISIINKFLCNFKELFSKKQFLVFSAALYALFSEYKRNCLYRMAETMKVDYQAFQYFFSESRWKLDELNNKRLRIIQNQRTTCSTSDGVLVIDDTSVPKPYSNNTEGARYQHCPSLKREEICNVTVMSSFSSKSKYFPINFKFYQPASEFRFGKNDYKFKSKISLARELIDDAISKNIKFSHICFDSWYGSDELLESIDQEGLKFIAELRPNRLINFYHPIQKRHCFIKQDELVKLTKSLYRHKLRSVKIHHPNGYRRSFLYYSFKSYLKDSPIKVRVIVLFGDFSDEDSKSIHILITNDLNGYIQTIVSNYMLRWNIERIFKELKDIFMFDQYQLRHKKQIERYWMMCFLAWSLVYWIKQNGYLNKTLSCRLNSFNDYKKALNSLLFIGSGSIISKNGNAICDSYGLKSHSMKVALGIAV